ncbi:MAG: glycosyltransferase family 2 protein [Acidobacteria bacterium]|nr:glycosyltransferase family 2 protein [Acidobacteriota bacterium]
MGRLFEAGDAPPARVLVSVLAYNSPDSTARTLRSLRGQTYSNFRLLLIDNASDGGSLESVAREFPEIEIERLPENRGYTGGNNFALGRARAEGYDCLLVVTHDVEVGPRALEYLLETAAAHPEAGVVGGVELDPRTGRERASAGGVYSKWFSRLSWQTAPEPEAAGPREVFCVHGALLLLTGSALAAGVRLDENIFMYFDEVDLGFQLAEKGLRALVDRRVVFKHTRGPETFAPRVGRLMQRNRLYVVRKHGRWFEALFYAIYSTLLELPAKVLVRSLQGRARFALACVAGQLEGLRGSSTQRHRDTEAQLKP